MDQQAASLQQQIRAHIDSTPRLKADQEFLTSIPGVGDIAAQQILAELPDVSQFRSAEAAAAFAGEMRHLSQLADFCAAFPLKP